MRHRWTKEEAVKAAQEKWRRKRACDNYRKALENKIKENNVLIYENNIKILNNLKKQNKVLSWIYTVVFSGIVGIIIGLIIK